MSDTKINQEVVRVLNEKTRDKEVIREFILELMWKEQEHSGVWRFRNDYRKILEKYSDKEG